jgi:hypothetical protein
MQANPASNRNFLINGGFDVWQRGTTFNPANAGVLTGTRYGADRWQMAYATSYANAFTRATVSGNLAYWGTSTFARMWRENGSTSTNPFVMQQSVESATVISANRPLTVSSKYVTLGFWCRTFKGSGGTANPFVTAEIITGTGTDSVVGSFTNQTTRATVTTSHALTDGVFRYYSVTFEVTSLFTQLGVKFIYAPTGTAGDFDVVEISGVQLENGSAPSEFLVEPVESVLSKCQRYFEKSYSLPDAPGANVTYDTGVYAPCPVIANAYISQRYKVTKRYSAIPSIWSGNGTANRIDTPAGVSTYFGIQFYGTEAYTLTTNSIASVGNVGWMWSVDAEL